jgi:hypothetical protein
MKIEIGKAWEVGQSAITGMTEQMGYGLERTDKMMG